MARGKVKRVFLDDVGAKNPVSVLSGTLGKKVRSQKDPNLKSAGSGKYYYTS